MIVVFEDADRRVVWNQSSTFHLERRSLNPGNYWVTADILTSYGVLGVEDAQTRAKWWITQLDNQEENQRDVE